MPATSAATRSFTFATARLLPFWWLHATVTEGMLEELAVGVITPDRCLKQYWWRSTITSPVGLGLLGLDFAEYAWKFDEVAVWCGRAVHIVYVVVDHEYNVVVQVP